MNQLSYCDESTYQLSQINFPTVMNQLTHRHDLIYKLSWINLFAFMNQLTHCQGSIFLYSSAPVPWTSSLVSQRGKKAALLFLLNVAGTAKKRWLITTNCCKWLTISVQTHVWSLLGPEINSKSYRNTSPQSSRDMAKAPVKKSFQLVVLSTLMNTLTKLQLTASRALISLILFIARSRDWTASTVKPGSIRLSLEHHSQDVFYRFTDIKFHTKLIVFNI